jgi:hypothetical protein
LNSPPNKTTKQKPILFIETSVDKSYSAEELSEGNTANFAAASISRYNTQNITSSSISTQNVDIHDCYKYQDSESDSN